MPIIHTGSSQDRLLLDNQAAAEAHLAEVVAVVNPRTNLRAMGTRLAGVQDAGPAPEAAAVAEARLHRVAVEEKEAEMEEVFHPFGTLSRLLSKAICHKGSWLDASPA